MKKPNCLAKVLCPHIPREGVTWGCPEMPMIEDTESSNEVDQKYLPIIERGTIKGCVIYGGQSPVHGFSFHDPPNAEDSDVEVDKDPLQFWLCKRQL